MSSGGFMAKANHRTQNNRNRSPSHKMFVVRSFLFVLLGLVQLGAGDDIVTGTYTYPLQGRLLFPGNGIPPTTKIILNGGEYETFSRVDGNFIFHDVKPGIYLLDVLSQVAMFSQIKINVPADPEGAIKCLEYSYPGAPKKPIPYPIELAAQAKLNFFEARPKVSVMGMLLGNPMMLMMGAMVLMLTLFPKMLGGDAMKEFQEQQAQMQEQMGDASNPMEMFSKLMSGDLLPPEPEAKSKQLKQGGASGKRGKRQQTS